MSEETESEATEGAEGEEEAKGGSGGKKIILFVVLPLVLILGALAGVYFSGLLDSPPEEPPATEGQGEGGADGAENTAQAEQEAMANAASEEPTETVPTPLIPGGKEVFFDMPELTVNLNNSGRKATFLRIAVTLELGSAEDEAIIQEAMPQVINDFQIYLRELRMEDLQGSAGTYRLREELLHRVTLAADQARIQDVLFKEILVQ